MDGQTEGRTDKWREGRREKASCRVVCPQLKTRDLDTLFRPPSLAKNIWKFVLIAPSYRGQ